MNLPRPYRVAARQRPTGSFWKWMILERFSGACIKESCFDFPSKHAATQHGKRESEQLRAVIGTGVPA